MVKHVRVRLLIVGLLTLAYAVQPILGIAALSALLGYTISQLMAEKKRCVR